MKWTPVVFSILALTLSVGAQPPAGTPPAGAPTAGAPGAAPGRGAGMGMGGGTVVSPEIAADGKVTFRLRAPNAKEVAVTGISAGATPGGGRLAMEKNDQGLWSVVTEALQPGIYTYNFVVDGLRITDPGNNRFQTGFNSASQSQVRVPGGLWTPSPGLARGAVTRHFYHSTIAGDDRDFWVYTPAGYDANRKEPYPVFFLLHGLGDEANSWIENGQANLILDHLIADGKAKPMIMVNTLGYGFSGGPANAMKEGMMDAFARVVIQETLPLVEKNYNAARNREGRAIAGLSMGGAESTFTGLNYLDTFAWIGSFSGAYVMWPRDAAPAPAPAAAPGAAPAAGAGRGAGGRGGQQITPEAIAKVFPKLDASTNSKIKLLWIACGTADSLIGVNRSFHEWLTGKGVKHTYIEVPDIAHVWPFWRQNVADFAPLLFR